MNMSPSAALAFRGAARAAPYLLLLLGAYSVFCVTSDDPFITYRYAANLWAGHGPVFNVGERVEGFTSPLHLLLSALLLKIIPSADILFKAKLAGVGLAALALWQTGRLARSAGLSERESLLAQLLVAVSNNFALAAVNGLETTLYLCLVLTSVLAFLSGGRRPGFASAVWLLGAWLARPEALLLFAGLLALCLVRAGPGRVRTVLPWAVAFILPLVWCLLGRYAYYGQLAPNTYYAKQVSWERGLHEGLLYLLHPLSPVAVAWNYLTYPVALWSTQWQALGAVAFWGLALLGLGRLRRMEAGAVLGVAALAQIAFVLRFGGDWMPGWRFLVPIVPLLAILQVHGLRFLRGAGWVRSAAAPAAMLALWGVCAAISPHNTWANARFSTSSADLLPADNALGRKWIVANRYIQTTFAPGSVLVYSEMGYAGYQNLDKNFVDVRGLTDHEIARLPASYKGTWGVDDETWMLPGDPLYAILQRRQPTAIIAFSHPPQMPAVVLDRYYLCASLRDPRDPLWVIDPALVYRPLDQILGKTSATSP